MTHRRRDFYSPPNTSDDVGSSSSSNSHRHYRSHGSSKYGRYHYCPPHHSGPYGPPPVTFTAEGNTGQAMPDQEGVIKFLGESGITTEGVDTDNTLNISNLRDLSKYVVCNDPDNGNDAEYATLHDAVTAAAEDPNSDPCNGNGVVVFVLPSPYPYQLTDAFTNDRKISIVGTSPSSQTAVFEGQTESYGNKSFSGIEFNDPCGHYHLTSATTKPQVQDKWSSWCKFTNNFKVSTDNHRLVFRNTEFDHGELSRDAVIDIDGGKGQLDACWCKFNICRVGKTEARRFIRLCSDTQDNTSRILASFGVINIDGSDPFTFVGLQGTQTLLVGHNHWNVPQARPELTFLFGHLKEMEDHEDGEVYRVVNPRARLEIEHNTVRSPSNQNLSVVGNLMTGRRNVAILHLNSSFQAARAIWLEARIPDGTESSYNFHNSWTLSNSDTPHFQFKLSNNNFVKLSLNSTPVETVNSRPIFDFVQEGIGNNAEFFFQATNLQSLGAGPMPPIIRNEIDVIDLNNFGVGLSGVDITTGSGVTNNLVISTTLV